MCAATQGSQQLIYKGKTQNVIKKINRKSKAQCTYEINNKRLRMRRPETNLQEKVSLSYKEKITIGNKKLN